MSFEFDNFIAEPCDDGNPGPVDPTTCSDAVPPSVDDRCADPAFYAANPDICAGYPQLILKPAFVITPSGGTVQYHTFLRAKGDEIELTQGLHYVTTNPSIAVIQADAGLLTGVMSGVTTVGVAWQNLSADAQVQVVETCASLEVDYCVLIDNSKSAGAGFGVGYSTRLQYAKQTAIQFAESLNFSKDKVAVAYFNESGVLVLEVGNTLAQVISSVNGIVQTSARTSIATGLVTAMDYLETLSGTKVVVLFSDGENNEGADPLPIATTWKEAGNVIAVVGLRAWGSHFDLLYRIATSGFFLSAYPATAQQVIDNLKAIKNFVCSSDCAPVAGTYPTAKLNYHGFANWDVVSGEVDLIGLDQWDLLPGNGLYVDLAGTTDPDNGIFNTSPGGIKTKTAFNFVSGHQYRLRVSIAGNQRIDGTNYGVHVLIKTVDGLTTLLDQVETPANFDEPFTVHTLTFTAGSSVAAKLLIEMNDPEVNAGSLNVVGPLIDVVILEDLTAPTTLLSDDFDDENNAVIPPQYSYYCSSFSSSSQKADPSPPPVIE